jgi:hypothetical protein
MYNISVSKADSCLIDTVHLAIPSKWQLADFQPQQKVGTPMDYVLACRGRSDKNKKNQTRLKNNFMKRLTVLAALLLTLCTTYSFATPANGGGAVITTSFNRDFQNAQLVSTQEYTGFTKVTFKMNDVVMFAFYNPSGELLAVTRNIVSSQLPVNLLTNLKKHYGDNWITDLFEFSGNEQNCYYISLENSDSKTTLRSTGSEWEVYSTSKK